MVAKDARTLLCEELEAPKNVGHEWKADVPVPGLYGPP
jgi:hypothetical protein